MSNRFEWDGLNELREELRNLPAELAQEASGIVNDAGESAGADIIAGYEAHRRSGNLAKGVRVKTVDAGQFGAGVRVTSTAPHADIFEIGTQARHTRLGANRGSMPPGNIFVPRAIRHRRRMYERLKELVENKGFEVSDDAG